MKKGIALLAALALCAVRLFADGYIVYRDDHKWTDKGHVLDVRLCFPKSSADDDLANARLDAVMQSNISILSLIIDATTRNITEVWLRSGVIYRITFFWHNIYGNVSVTKGNTKGADGPYLRGGEDIYVQHFAYDYDDCYAEYERQCNKYLDML